MVLPILNYLRLQSALDLFALASLGHRACVASVFGSYSRGGYIALGALAVAFWLRAKNKFVYPIAAAIVLVPLLKFMPNSFYQRADSIQQYSTDASFQRASTPGGSPIDTRWITSRSAPDFMG